MGLLDRVTSAAASQPSRVYLYAAEKWGKTSWAAQAPRPIFLMTAGETGLLDLINYGQIGATPHFPEDIKSWPELLAVVRSVASEPHDYQTLVIDTANGAERLLADHVLHTEFEGRMSGKNGYSSYGKGDLACVPHWGEFLRELDFVRSRRRMSIVLLAHSKVKTVNNPEGDDYDQLRPEGIDKLWPLTHKWASVIAAGTYRVVVKDEKADGGRDRVIRLRGTAAVVAGNRYGLPETIPAGSSAATAWKAFADSLRVAKARAATIPTIPSPKNTTPADTSPDQNQDEDGDPVVEPTPLHTPHSVPPESPASVPPESPASVPPIESPTPPQKIGGDLVQRLIQQFHDLGVSWPQVRDDQVTAEFQPGSGIAASVGFTSTLDLKIGALTPDQGFRLFKLCEAAVAAKKARGNGKAKKAEGVGA